MAVAGAEQEANKAPADFDSAFAEFDSPAETPSQFEHHPQESTLLPTKVFLAASPSLNSLLASLNDQKPRGLSLPKQLSRQRVSR